MNNSSINEEFVLAGRKVGDKGCFEKGKWVKRRDEELVGKKSKQKQFRGRRRCQ